MKCNNCGNEIESGNNFCPYCGVGVSYYTTNVQQPVYADNMQNGQMQAAVGNVQQNQSVAPKIKNGALTKAFLTISIFNFVNLFLHVFSYVLPFIITELDYVFYAIKIMVYFAVGRFLKKNGFKDFVATVKFLKATIVLDAIEVFISVVNSDLEIMPWLLIALMAFKFIVNFLIYKDFIYIAKEEKSYISEACIDMNGLSKMSMSWSWCHFFIALLLVLTAFFKNPAFIFAISIFLIMRFVYELNLIKKTVKKLDGHYDVLCGPKPDVSDNSFLGRMHYSNPKKKKWVPVALAGVLSVVLALGIYAYFSFNKEGYASYLEDKELYASGQQYEEDVRPNEYCIEYCVYNNMPSWTGLRRDRWGFFNTKTGMDSGPRYKSVEIDVNGIVWNGKNYMNTDGEVVVKAPLWAKLTVSKRQHFLRDIFNVCFYDNDEKIIADSFEDWEVYQYGGANDDWPIFKNGITYFKCDLTDNSGILRDDGSVVVAPIYDSFYWTDERKFFIFTNRMKTRHYVMNADGKIIFRYKDRIKDINIYDSGVVLYRNDRVMTDDRKDGPLNNLIDEYGNSLEGLYCEVDDTDGMCFHKYTGKVYGSGVDKTVSGGYTTILVIDGKVCYETDKYDAIKVEKDKTTGEIIKITGITKSGDWESLDIKLN